jgi:hypothetical protein
LQRKTGRKYESNIDSYPGTELLVNYVFFFILLKVLLSPQMFYSGHYYLHTQGKGKNIKENRVSA